MIAVVCVRAGLRWRNGIRVRSRGAGVDPPSNVPEVLFAEPLATHRHLAFANTLVQQAFLSGADHNRGAVCPAFQETRPRADVQAGLRSRTTVTLHAVSLQNREDLLLERRRGHRLACRIALSRQRGRDDEHNGNEDPTDEL